MPLPTLTEDEILLVIRALDHYQAYLLATQRNDARYTDLAERLKRKGPEREENEIKSIPKTTYRKRR